MKYFINPNGSIPIKTEFISPPKWECLLSGVPFCGWDAQIRKGVIDVLAKRNWNEVKQRWTAIKDPKTHWFRVVTAIAKMKLPNNYIYPDDNVEVLSGVVTIVPKDSFYIEMKDLLFELRARILILFDKV